MAIGMPMGMVIIVGVVMFLGMGMGTEAITYIIYQAGALATGVLGMDGDWNERMAEHMYIGIAIGIYRITDHEFRRAVRGCEV
jgi:TRAP-type uncharacterized transport system fused permease subunit